jgi:hypothetical protein
MALLFCAASAAQAVPAMPGVFSHVQSGGGSVYYSLHGDEFLHYITDEKGFLIAFGEDGDLYYAKWAEENAGFSPSKGLNKGQKTGFAISTGVKVPGDAFSSRAAVGERPMRPLREPIPRYLLDQARKMRKERDAGWREQFKKESQITGRMGSPAFVPPAPTQKSPKVLMIYVRFEDETNLVFDVNGNGTLETTELSVGFIVHGYETSVGIYTTEGCPSVWGHAGGVSATVGGKQIYRYFAEGAFQTRPTASIPNRPLTIGIITHELGHAGFGFLDLYEVNNHVPGLGMWSLIASGSWGALSGQPGGPTPAALDAFHLQSLRAPQSGSSGTYTLSGVHQYARLTSTNANQYFLLQPRGNVGYDQGFTYGGGSWTSAPSGVIIYHVDDEMTGCNNLDYHPHLHVAVEEAHGGTQHLQAASSSNRGRADDLFGSGEVFFNDMTDPSSKLYDSSSSPQQNTPSGVLVGNIASTISGPGTNTGTVSAVFTTLTIQGNLPDGVLNRPYNWTLQASIPEVAWSLESGTLPVITVHPQPQTVNAGSDAAFTVTAVNAASYQWQISAGSTWQNLSDGQQVSGSGTDRLTWRDARTDETNYQFRCIASNDSGSATSNAATLTVLSPVIVITTPSLPDGEVGRPYSAALAATGAGVIWSLADGFLPNGLSLPSSGVISGTPTASGLFSFTVKASNGTVSATKALNVSIASPSGTGPVITVQPQSQAVDSGTDAVFEVTATNAAVYQWQMSVNSGATWQNISDGPRASGSVTDRLTWRDVRSDETSYQFRCAVSNDFSSVTSSAVTLTVLFSTITITTSSLPEGVVGRSYGAALTATGSGSITWVIVSGAPPSGLSLSPNGIISGVPTSRGSSSFTVSASNGTVSAVKALSVNVVSTGGSEPVIITHPQSQTVRERGNAHFAVLAEFNAAFYQWQISTGGNAEWAWENLVNGQRVTGSNTDELVWREVRADETGFQFRCVVSNYAGSVTSDAATLTVLSASGGGDDSGEGGGCDSGFFGVVSILLALLSLLVMRKN